VRAAAGRTLVGSGPRGGGGARSTPAAALARCRARPGPPPGSRPTSSFWSSRLEAPTRLQARPPDPVPLKGALSNLSLPARGRLGGARSRLAALRRLLREPVARSSLPLQTCRQERAFPGQRQAGAVPLGAASPTPLPAGFFPPTYGWPGREGHWLAQFLFSF